MKHIFTNDGASIARAHPLVPCLLLGVGIGAGCGSDTGRARISFPVALSATEVEHDALGAEVVLEQARFRAEGLELFEGEPLFSTWWDRLRRVVVGVAWAHPGHYVPGAALADLKTAVDIDLLGGPVPWGTANGVTGSYRSARLDGVVLELEGRVGTASTSRPFALAVAFEEPITGMAVEPSVEPAPSALRLEIDLGALIEGIPFSAGGEPAAVGSRAHNAFVRGARSAAIYRAHAEG